jgi:hypothetical protein
VRAGKLKYVQIGFQVFLTRDSAVTIFGGADAVNTQRLAFWNAMLWGTA